MQTIFVRPMKSSERFPKIFLTDSIQDLIVNFSHSWLCPGT
jgi:hypothetical protein